jgi:PKD repeat protein/subtilisin family serine protease
MFKKFPSFILLISILTSLLLVSGNLYPVYANPKPPKTNPPSSIEIESALQYRLNTTSDISYMIYFSEKADLSAAQDLPWSERGWYVMNALQETADRSQKPVRDYLDAHNVEYQAFWIDNVIMVSESDYNTFDGLLKFNEIEALRATRTMQVIEPEVENQPLDAVESIESNISHVLAPDVWQMGYAGQGSVVANIDTGVRYTHEAVNAQYRGNLGAGNYDHNYNWWDPYGDHPTAPEDDNSHGSHTMGTMVGDDGSGDQIGMAPDADWIACRGCSTSSCGGLQLLSCAQWVAAPWDLNGDNPNPDMRPFVVNNSWGSCSRTYDPWYQGVVDAWQAAGIYPVFSNGNSSNCGYSSPPGLNTVGNPARYGNVTGVGSSGHDNGAYASHSNWGPTDNLDTINPQTGWADLKPQVLAPGVSIRSSVNSSDSAYANYSGTSMSSPHVSGLIALMWQAAPCLIGDYVATEMIIEQTATPIPYDDGTTGSAHSPNYATGWGEINALAAVEAAQDYCGAFRLNISPLSQTICAPTNAVYDVDVIKVEEEYSEAVTLSVQNTPSGYSPSFSLNPVTPSGSSELTLSGSPSAAYGNYQLKIIGEAASETFTTTVELNLFTAAPDQISLLSPANDASGIHPSPTFTWNSAEQAAEYTIELASDEQFNDLIYTTSLQATSLELPISLDPLTAYYWRVKADNICGVGESSPVYHFETRTTPPILVVDDDNNSPDVSEYYTSVLDDLGYAYDLWETNYSDNEPNQSQLQPYDLLIWFTGASYGGFAGPSSASESVLANWLNEGNDLFISSQDYYWDRGLTAFMSNYLGVANMSNDVGYYTSISGQGSVFNGLGNYSLDYPFYNYSDMITPNTSAEVAFIGNNQNNAALNKDTGVYRTTFWAFPFESLSEAARLETLQTILDWSDVGEEKGTLTGNITTAVSGSAIQGAAITAVNGSYQRAAVSDADGNYTLILPAGSYEITVEDETDGISTASNVIINAAATTVHDFAVNNPPKAMFQATPLSGQTPLQVSFTNQSTGNITHTTWDFGDGTSSTEQNPVHIYQRVGSYTVSLTVQGADGSHTETKAAYITVTALAQEEITPEEGGAVEFTLNGDTNVKATIPAGSVTTQTTIQVTSNPEVRQPNGFNLLGESFDIHAIQDGNLVASFLFSNPITLYFEYADRQLTNIQENTLKLYLWDEGSNQWIDAAESCAPASTYTYNLTENWFSVNICHLSQFAIFGESGSQSIFIPLVMNR